MASQLQGAGHHDEAMRPCGVNRPVKRGIGVVHNLRRSRRTGSPDSGKILRGDRAIAWISGEDGLVNSSTGQMPDDFVDFLLSRNRDEQDRSASVTHASDG